MAAGHERDVLEETAVLKRIADREQLHDCLRVHGDSQPHKGAEEAQFRSHSNRTRHATDIDRRQAHNAAKDAHGAPRRIPFDARRTRHTGPALRLLPFGIVPQ